MQFTTDFQNAEQVVNVLNRAGEYCLGEAYRDKSVVRLPDKGRLLATGDLHDNPFHLDAILKLAKLDASTDHHVYFHELIHGENFINGLDYSHRMLIKVAELKAKYPDQVHLILANHEIAQMTGAGVSKGAGDCTALFNDAVDQVYGDHAEDVRSAINAFIRSWPIALVTASGILCSHSVPATHALDRFDAKLLERNLTDADFQSPDGSAYLMVWGRNHSGAHLDRLAELFGVEAFILGHEPAETGYEPVGSRGLVLNSDHESGAVVTIDLAESPPKRDEWLWAVTPLRSVLETG
ncbi:MAG: hypothetical protein ACF8PN_05850 [Phycisphaerales bacterium]